MKPDINIIGGGLAGCEAAWQAAQKGLLVRLFEMRPAISTGAHRTSDLAELICSNSLGSNLPDRASGLLKNELRQLDCMLLECAEANTIPAGAALAVDREAFAQSVTKKINSHTNIELVRQEVTSLPDGPTIIASGPLTSQSLSETICRLTGQEHLFFYDAIAPIVTLESINLQIAFIASRYGKGIQPEGDYINCPFSEEEYHTFWSALVDAERIELRDFEGAIQSGVDAGSRFFFEGCLPIEIIARRGQASLAFGPMRPVGLTKPHNGDHPYAVLQLRQDNLAGSLYNMVGFQTNLTFPEQQKVFRLIPGLEQAEFVRYGQMHRNTFIASPELLLPTLQMASDPNIFFAGQITGIEGYMGNIATGLLAGWNAANMISGKDLLVFPRATMIGALCHYITHAKMIDFQPMKANLGILPPLENPTKITAKGKIRQLDRRERATLLVTRAQSALKDYLETKEAIK